MQKTKSFFMAAIATLSMTVTASAQTKVDVIVDTDRGTTTISLTPLPTGCTPVMTTCSG